MPSENNSPTSRAGIVTSASGQRSIPSSTRADGTTRREIKIRPGYRPPEDVEVYRNRTAQAFRTRGAKAGVPGADAADENESSKPATAASNKNAKRREARRKAKAATEDSGEADGAVLEDDATTAAIASTAADAQENGTGSVADEIQCSTAELTIDPQAEREKKVKRLKKKLREARELQQKRERGQGLLPEQLQKAIKINEIIRELDQLGYDADGEAKEQ